MREDNFITAPILFSKQFNIDSKILTKLGVFNPILNVDTKLFVSPLLLSKSSSPIIKNAINTYNSYFANILNLLSSSTEKDDRCWRTAKRFVSFKEFSQTCIGYSSMSTSGNGMGTILSDEVFQSATEIIKLGCKDPEIFLLLPLLEDGIGADRISDMTQSIIEDDICKYTLDVMKKLGLNGNFEHTTKNHKTYNLLKNPFSNKVVLLVPKDVLEDLPNPEQFIWDISNKNKELRDKLNQYLGNIFSSSSKLTLKDKKVAVINGIKTNKELFLDIINILKKGDYRLDNYDTNDPKGLYRWLENSDAFTNISFAQIDSPVINSLDELSQLVHSLILNFKNLIEEHKLRTLFWTNLNGFKKHVNEGYTQKLFCSICRAWLTAQNSNVSCHFDDSNNSIKFATTSDCQVITYLKHADNKFLKQSYDKLVSSILANQKYFYTILNFQIEDRSVLQKIMASKSTVCKFIEIDTTLKDNDDIDHLGDISDIIDSKYKAEKTKGGASSYQYYKPLKEKVEELCLKILNSQPNISANQLSIEVSKILLKDHKKLLKEFEPYKKYLNDNIDWLKPTFYNWCNDIKKSYKSK